MQKTDLSTCRDCKETKPIDEFRSIRGRGRSTYCKKCQTQRASECTRRQRAGLGLAKQRRAADEIAADERKKRLDAWLTRLRAEGVSAAHPDGIWVDWEQRRIVLFDPYFVEQTKRNSRVAVGSPDFWRVVRLERVTERYALGFVQYEFFEVEG